MKSKRALSAILAILSAVTIVGCSGKNGGDQVTTGAETTKTEDSKKTETTVAEETVMAGTETNLGTFENKYEKYISYRGNLNNTYSKLVNDKKLKVAYFGGSVTFGVGASNGDSTSWRGLFGNWIKEQFPDAEVENINLAISGTGSKLGLFRLEHDVVPHCPDLIFIEYAVNDFFLKESADQIKLQNETMIRRLYEMNPKIDIVYLYTEGVSSANSGRRGLLYTAAEAQDTIAKYYGVSGIAIGKALTDTISNKSSSSSAEWLTYYQDGVHPIDAGYSAYFDVIKEFFVRNFALYNGENAKDKTLPDAPKVGVMQEYELICGEDLKNAVGGDWRYNTQSYTSGDKISYKGSFIPTSSDKVLEYTFTGKGLALFFTGSTITDIRYSVDGGGWEKIDSDGNRPFTVLFDINGEPGEHTVKLKCKDGVSTSINIYGLLAWYK